MPKTKNDYSKNVVEKFNSISARASCEEDFILSRRSTIDCSMPVFIDTDVSTRDQVLHNFDPEMFDAEYDGDPSTFDCMLSFSDCCVGRDKSENTKRQKRYIRPSSFDDFIYHSSARDRDADPYNQSILVRISRTGDYSLIRHLRGYTVMDDIYFPFPMNMSKREAFTWRDEYLRLSKPDRKEVHSPNRIRGLQFKSSYPKDSLEHICFLIRKSLGPFSIPSMSLVRDDIYAIFVAPVFEEIVKSWNPGFPGAFGFAVVEFAIRIRQHGLFNFFTFVSLFPFCFHLFLSQIESIFLRMFLHLLWNSFCVFCLPTLYLHLTGSLINESSLKILEELAWDFDLIRKMINHDTIGLMLSFAQIPGRYQIIQDLCLSSNVDLTDLLRKVSEAQLEEDSVVFMNLPEVSLSESPVYRLLGKIVPKKFMRSPATMGVATLVLFIASSQFTSDFYVVQKLSSYFGAPFGENVGLLEMCIGILQAVYSGVQAVCTTGNYLDFFYFPKDPKFIVEANALLYASDEQLTERQLLDLIAKSDMLIDGRRFEVNTPEINRLLTRLCDYSMVKKKYINKLRPRKMPLLIWITGSPGTGKTVLYTSLIDMICVRAGIERFTGDVIHYNIFDKFPASTSLNSRARFLVINDVPADYSDFPQRDILPLDVLLQQALDTCMFTIRAAAVEDKGLVLTDIEYVIINSNSACYKFPNEAEKLDRRISDGIVVSYEVMKKEGKTIAKFSEFKDLSDPERLAATRIVPLKPIIEGKFLKFQPTTVSYNFPGFISWIMRRIDEVAIHRENQDKKFLRNPCECGLAYVYHKMPCSDTDIILKGGESVDSSFTIMTPNCLKYLEVNPHFRLRHRDEEAHRDALKAHLDSQIVFEQHCNEDEFLNEEEMIFVPTEVELMMKADLGDKSMVGIVMFSLIYCYIDYYFVFFSVISLFYLFRDDIRDSFFRRDESIETLSWLVKMNFIRPEYVTRANAYRQYLRAKSFYLNNELLFKVLLSAGAIGVILKMYFQREAETMAKPVYSERVVPESMYTTNHREEMNFTPERRRDWAKPEGTIQFVELQKYGVGFADLEKKVRNQILKVQMKFDGVGHREVQIFVVTPEFFMMNCHYVMGDGANSEKIMFTDTFSVDYKGTVLTLSHRDLVAVPDTEYYLVRHYFPGIWCSLLSFFPKSKLEMQFDCTRVSPDLSVDSVAKCTSVPMHGSVMSAYEWNDKIVNGDCGSVLLGKIVGGCFITGLTTYRRDSPFAIFGSGVVAGASIISKEHFERAVSKTAYPLVEGINFIAPFEKLLPLSENSQFRNVKTPCILMLGTLDRPNQKFSSDFIPSRYYDDLHSKLSEPYGIPKNVVGIFDNEYMSSVTNTFKNFGMTHKGTSFEREVAMLSYLNDCAPPEFIKEKAIKMSPLTLQEAFFGVPEHGFTGMPMNTSCGPLLSKEGIKNKYDLFNLFESADKSIFVFNEKFRVEVDDMIKDMIDGILPVCVLAMVNKDEVRPLSKLIKMKVRLFSNLHNPLNAVARMYLLPLITYLLDQRDRSECYGSMNAGSKEWDEMARDLFDDESFLIDMDFVSFDTSHKMEMLTLASFFIYLLALRLGYSLEAAKVAMFTIRAILIQYCIYNNDVFIKFGGLPSGFILTLILNSIINSILARMAFGRLVYRDTSLFRQFVRVKTVGDDNLSRVKKTIAAKYNMVTIKPVYEAYGYEVTNASKSAIIVPFVARKDAVFLKRSFRLDEELGYVAPIAPDSIYKSLCFEKKELGISSAQRLDLVGLNAQREAFLHGLEFFSEIQKLVVDVAAKHNIQQRTLSFDGLKHDYLERTFVTFDC